MGGIGGCAAQEGRTPDREALERLAGALSHRSSGGTHTTISGSVGLVSTTRIKGNLAIDGASTQAAGGDLAFAALDDRRRHLTLARDGIGLKPLYWAKHDGQIWFASEIRALLAAGVPALVRPDVLRMLVSLGWTGREETLFEEIQRVMPGCRVQFDLTSLAPMVERSYDINGEVDAGLQAELRARPREELVDLLEARLDEAVNACLDGPGAFAFFCSGGLDSSLIAALGSRRRPGAPAFAASLSVGGVRDELPYAQLLARALGLELEVVKITPASMRETLVGAVLHHGSPMEIPVGVGISQVAEAASRAGVSIAILGDVADALFGGDWGRHRAAFAAFLPPSELRRRRLRLLRSMRLTEARAAVGRRLSHGPAASAAWVNLDGASPSEDEVTMRAVRAYGGDGPRARLAGGMLSDLSLITTHAIVRDDANTAQHAVEGRVPFLDRGVLRLALNLPLEARVTGAQKGILSELGARHLPAAIVRRRKVAGMMTANCDWLTGAARKRFLDQGMVRDLLGLGTSDWRALLGAAPTNQTFALWTAETWLRLTAGGMSPAAVEAELWGS